MAKRERKNGKEILGRKWRCRWVNCEWYKIINQKARMDILRIFVTLSETKLFFIVSDRLAPYDIDDL